MCRLPERTAIMGCGPPVTSPRLTYARCSLSRSTPPSRPLRAPRTHTATRPPSCSDMCPGCRWSGAARRAGRGRRAAVCPSAGFQAAAGPAADADDHEARPGTSWSTYLRCSYIHFVTSAWPLSIPEHQFRTTADARSVWRELQRYATYHVPVGVLAVIRHLHQIPHVVRVRADLAREELCQLERPVYRVEQVIL